MAKQPVDSRGSSSELTVRGNLPYIVSTFFSTLVGTRFVVEGVSGTALPLMMVNLESQTALVFRLWYLSADGVRHSPIDGASCRRIGLDYLSYQSVSWRQ